MIKKTTVNDYESLVNLERECFSFENWNLNQIISHHESQNSILCFEEILAPIGYLVFLENQFEIEILRIGVLPAFRRKGIAEKLLDFLDSLRKNRDIILEVKSENTPAILLYKKKGFKNFAVRKRYYPDGADAILMKKEAK